MGERTDPQRGKSTTRKPSNHQKRTDALLDVVLRTGEPYYLIAVRSGSSVYTPERIQRDAAIVEAARQEREAARQRAIEEERVAVEQWRQTIRAGAETGCGPVLRVNGDLIEVVYYQTREPKWYRRSELWPTLFNKEGYQTCN